MLICRTRPSDTEEPAVLTKRIFRKAFETGNTQKDMELHYQANYSTDIQLQEALRENWIMLICEYESGLIGHAQLRWGAFPSYVNSIHVGEVLYLYIGEPYHDKGFTQALIHRCFAELAARGSDIVWLGVREQNPGIASFYHKLGFAEVGEHTFLVGTDPQRNIIMKRSADVS